MNKFLHLLCPNEFVESVVLIEPARLKDRGIRVLLMDLDNTLVPWGSYDIAAEVEAWVGRIKGSGIGMCIVSNTRSPKRLRVLAERLSIPHVIGSKPRRGGFRKALEMLKASPEQVAVVGDQLFTDILGGNRLGSYTILVHPIHPREFVGTKVSRLFEKIVFRLLEQRGMLHRTSIETCVSGEQSEDKNRQMKTEQ